VFIHDAPTIWRIGAAPEHQGVMGLFWPLTRESLAWAVNRSDEALRDAVDAQLAAWRESGRAREILRRWIPVRVEIR
jgi:ABC-type amino acid transport substrate-binding protein